MSSQILIEPIINSKSHGIAIQARTFQVNFKITNHSNSPSESFTISRVVMGSAQGQNIRDDFGRRSFSVGIINPGESIMIDVGKNGQFMFGLINITATIVSSDASRPIKFFQKNPFTGSLYEIGENHWLDFFYIKSSSEDLQEKTNRWLVILTWVIAISAIITISPTLLFFYKTQLAPIGRTQTAPVASTTLSS